MPALWDTTDVAPPSDQSQQTGADDSPSATEQTAGTNAVGDRPALRVLFPDTSADGTAAACAVSDESPVFSATRELPDVEPPGLAAPQPVAEDVTSIVVVCDSANVGDPRVCTAHYLMTTPATSVDVSPDDTSTDDPQYMALLGRLDALLAAPVVPPTPTSPALALTASAPLSVSLAPVEELDNGWPRGPIGLRQSDIAILIQHILTDETFTTAP